MSGDDQTVTRLLEILKSEFGIKTEAELDKAIKRLPAIDLSPFCGKIRIQKEAVL